MEFDSRAHLLHREQVAAERGFAAATADNLGRIQDATATIGALLTAAQLDYGPVQHGASVNPTLADYMRELDAAERAMRNARNALRALEAERRAAANAKPAVRRGA